MIGARAWGALWIGVGALWLTAVFGNVIATMVGTAHLNWWLILFPLEWTALMRLLFLAGKVLLAVLLRIEKTIERRCRERERIAILRRVRFGSFDGTGQPRD